jgi:hypothetical protein
MTDTPSSLIIVPADAVPQVEEPIITQLKALKQEDEALAYAEAEEFGKLCQRNMDTGRWLIGELANFVETEYAERSIEVFADGINVDAERVKEYRTMVRFWTFSARADISTLDGVTYSHMRAAKGLGDLEAAKEFVRTCSLNKWPVWEARNQVNALKGKVTAKKLYDAYMTVGKVYQTGEFVVMPGERAEVEEGVMYRMVLYEVHS